MVNKLGAVCAVYGCNNYKQQKGESKSFFRMPRNPTLLKSWIFACRRRDLDDLLKSEGPDYFYKTYVVCSDHFRVDCFRNKNLLSQGLLRGSVPTEKLFNVESLTKRKTREQTEEVEAKKVRIDERLKEEVPDEVVLDGIT